MMMQHTDFQKYNLKSIRTGWIGGSNIPEEVVKNIRDKIGMPDLVSVYGMTETTSVTTFTKKIQTAARGNSIHQLDFLIEPPTELTPTTIDKTDIYHLYYTYQPVGM